MLAAKIAALILKQLRSCRGVGEAGAFGRYQDFGICPKRAHRCEPLRLPEVKPQSGPPCHHETEIADSGSALLSRPIRLADGVLCGRTALKAPVMIELDSREATDGQFFRLEHRRKKDTYRARSTRRHRSLLARVPPDGSPRY